MGTGASIGTVFAGPAGYLLGSQYDMAKDAADAQEQAAKVAADNAKKQADLADQAYNKANAKSPDVGAMLAANSKQSALASTMLTGTNGSNAGTITLGKSTLLGA